MPGRYKKKKNELKAFICKLCDTSFTRNARLKTQISSVHENKKRSHKCPISLAKYAHRTGMVNHIKRERVQLLPNLIKANHSALRRF